MANTPAIWKNVGIREISNAIRELSYWIGELKYLIKDKFRQLESSVIKWRAY